MSSTINEPESVKHAMMHHARELAPLVGMLAMDFLLELQPYGWELRQSRDGANSFSISKGTTQFHLRGRREKGHWLIVVRDRYCRGNVVAEIRTRADVFQFTRLVRSS